MARRCWKFVRPAAQFAEESRLDSKPEGGTILQPVVPAIFSVRLQCFSKISDEYENLDVPAHLSWRLEVPGSREVMPGAEYIALSSQLTKVVRVISVGTSVALNRSSVCVQRIDKKKRE